MNILGYAKKVMDQKFDALPFSNVDALILAELSYLNFYQIIEEEDFIRFADVETDDKKSFYASSFDAVNNRRLFELIQHSQRYKDIEVGFCKFYDNLKDKTQFYAVTFLLPDGKGYISYRGTDVSINGWREDFLIAYQEQIPGVPLAAKYIREACKKFDGDFYVGGHSKGGNLAVYSALNLDEKSIKRIIKIYSFDGPGSKKEITDFKHWETIVPKIEKYITVNDMIGVVYNKIKTAKIVNSSGILLGGHDLFTWPIDGKTLDFKYTKDRSFISKSHEEALMNWLVNMTSSEKQLAVDILCEFFGESETIFDLLLKAGRNVSSGKSKWNSYPIEERERAKMIFKKLAKYYLEAYSLKAITARKKENKQIEEAS